MPSGKHWISHHDNHHNVPSSQETRQRQSYRNKVKLLLISEPTVADLGIGKPGHQNYTLMRFTFVWILHKYYQNYTFNNNYGRQVVLFAVLAAAKCSLVPYLSLRTWGQDYESKPTAHKQVNDVI